MAKVLKTDKTWEMQLTNLMVSVEDTNIPVKDYKALRARAQ